MEWLKNRFESLFQRIFPRRQDACRFIVAMFFAAIFLLIYRILGNRFTEIMEVANAVLWISLLSAIGFFAGFTVLKALFLVAAELSLLIFLAQSYCDLPVHSDEGVNAMRDLLFIGLLYIAIAFYQSFRDILRDYNKKLGKGPIPKEGIFVITVFFIFAFLFLRQVYLVISPIISNLYMCK